jgi:hypothetical protein
MPVLFSPFAKREREQTDLISKPRAIFSAIIFLSNLIAI